jgi:Flp pilus assembly protein TadD
MRSHKTLALFILAMGLVFALSAWAQKKPFMREQVQGLVQDGLGDEAGAKLIEQRGIDFAPAEDFLQSLKVAGASEAFLKALRAAKRPEPASAKMTKRATVHPVAQARQDEIRRHVARGAELKQEGQYAEAEQEYRAALLLDPQNADLYANLAYVLVQQKKWDDAVSATREALRLWTRSWRRAVGL